MNRPVGWHQQDYDIVNNAFFAIFPLTSLQQSYSNELKMRPKIGSCQMSYRPTVERSSNKTTLMRFMAGILSYVINYISCGFLTPVILLTLAAIVFSYTAFTDPQTSFLSHYTSLLPAKSGQSVRLNGDDIMRIYGIVTTALFVLSVVPTGLKRVLRRLKRPTPPMIDSEASEVEEANSNRPGFSQVINRRRLIVTSIVITAIFALSLIMIPFAHLAVGESEVTWYIIFIILYLIVLISNGIYVGMGSVSDKLYEWATS